MFNSFKSLMNFKCTTWVSSKLSLKRIKRSLLSVWLNRVSAQSSCEQVAFPHKKFCKFYIKLGLYKLIIVWWHNVFLVLLITSKALMLKIRKFISFKISRVIKKFWIPQPIPIFQKLINIIRDQKNPDESRDPKHNPVFYPFLVIQYGAR